MNYSDWIAELDGLVRGEIAIHDVAPRLRRRLGRALAAARFAMLLDRLPPEDAEAVLAYLATWRAADDHERGEMDGAGRLYADARRTT